MPDRIERYLELAGEQIRWKRAKPALLEELRTHLLDQRDDCLAEGMSEEEAQAEAVRQMGDPVTVGQGLDSVHRPKAQWSLLAITTAVAVTGVVLRLYLTAGQDWLASTGLDVPRTVLGLVLGIAALLGGYFLDYTFLGRHGTIIYLFALASTAFYFPVEAGNVPYYFSHFVVLYPVVYAAWLYAWRREGWKGFLLSVLGLFPLTCVGTGPYYRYLSEVLILLFVGLLLLLVLGWQDWYGIGKGKTVGVLLGVMGLLSGLGVVKVLMSDYLWNRLLYAIHPELDPLGDGYTGLTIQQALETAQWTGQGEWTGAHPYEMSVYDGQGDFFLTTIIHKLGWLPFLLLMLVFFLLTAWMLVKCLKQKNTLAKITVLAVVVPLLIRGIWAVIMNLGVVMLTVHFPLITGNMVMLTDMSLIGLALSIFRQENLPMGTTISAKPCINA